MYYRVAGSDSEVVFFGLALNPGRPSLAKGSAALSSTPPIPSTRSVMRPGFGISGLRPFKELTYRWAEHYPAGELKHGPLALISTGAPVVVVDNAHPKLAANVAEVRARGGRIIGIGAAGSTVPVVDRPYAPWGPLATAVPLQILARTLALALGRDVDKPRNLAKSVTVESSDEPREGH
jgi:hypothetical protein